jgi:DNA-binding NarL/FixJ family response regulator
MSPLGNGAPIRVLVVDDHRVFADALALRLRSEPDIAEVEVAFSVGEGRALANRRRPDVVLLDYNLDGECGTDLIATLRALDPPARALMLSGASETSSVIASIESGAEGFVLKDADLEVLLTAVSEVLHGRLYLDPALVGPVVTKLLREARGPSTAPTWVDELSPRELEVLRCLVDGMTRAEMAQRLFISTNTVRTHVQRVLAHAQVHSTPALVAVARRLGVAGVDETWQGQHPSST